MFDLNALAFFAFWAFCFGCLMWALMRPVEIEEETVSVSEEVENESG